MILSRTGVLFLLVLTLSCSSERLVSNLTPGDVLTFDWPINAPSEFLVECTAGQPEAFVLSQEGIDLEFEIWDPKGQSLFKWDSQTAGTGSEIAGLHPAQTGTYRLKVRAFHDETEGSFSIERISHSKKQYIEDIVLATETIFSAENLKANQRVDEFLTLLTKAKNIWLSHGNREQAAMTWWRVPAFMEQLSDQNGAVQGYREVVALLRQSDHSAMLALAYHRLGVAALRKGDSQSSMEALKQAIALRQRPDLDRAASILELGKCHTFSGQPQQSLPLLLEAQAIYEHLNYQPGLASLHGSIGWHYHHLGHYKKALTHYDKGLKWAKNFPKKQISILSYQAMTMIQIGESKRAIEALDRQRPLLESVGDPNEGLAFWKINRAEALLLQNRPRAAEPLLRESMDLLPEDVSAARAHLLFNLARAIAGQKDKSIDEAVAFMREALAYSDQLNFKNSAPESRMLYAVSRDGYADYLLDLLMVQAKNSAWEGVLLNESRRALMQDGRDFIHSDEYNRELVKAVGLAVHRDKNERFTPLQDVSLPVPSNWPQKTSNHSIDLTALQKELGQNTTLLYFGFGQSRIFAWVVTQDDVNHFELGRRDQLENKIRDYYEAVKDIYTPNHLSWTKQKAKDISAIVLKPIAKVLQGNHLLIVPDGELYRVPFAALPNPQDAYETPLIAHFSISYLSSLQQGFKLKEHRKPNTENQSVLVVANPKYGKDFPALKATLQEARALERHAVSTGIKPKLLTGPNANKEHVLNESLLGQFDYLHFACHSNYYESISFLSSLILSTRNQSGESIDGFLTPHEIANQSLKAKLVTLSACETALGQNIRIRGIGGLTKAFIDAGAAGVVVSLWKIEDAATASLMDRFYAHLWQDKSPRRALQLAQQEMASMQKYNAPFYWAGFIYLGAW